METENYVYKKEIKWFTLYGRIHIAIGNQVIWKTFCNVDNLKLFIDKNIKFLVI